MAGLVRPCVVSFVLLSALTGVVYPGAVTGVAAAAFPEKAHGSLVHAGGTVTGSRLLGQPFSDPRYFWGRPSATTPFPNDPAASGASNLGPSNPALVEAVTARIAALRAADPGNDAKIPVDLVTTSGSGLDPHVSPAAARYQVRRVARARSLDEARVAALVESAIEGPDLGIFGEPRVDVLRLNTALDALH